MSDETPKLKVMMIPATLKPENGLAVSAGVNGRFNYA